MKTDRDRSIERLLRRTPETEAPLSGDCPDIEALAALADDALSAAERRRVEAHLADCDRCQAMTAAMIRTAAEDVGIPTPFWSRRLNWLVPAAAAATAVALWVAVPGQRPPAPAQPLAEAPTPAPPSREPANAPAEESRRFSAGGRADDPARGNDAAAALGSTTSADTQRGAPAERLSEQDQKGLARQERAASEPEPQVTEPDRMVLDRSATLAAARAAGSAAAGFEVRSPDPLIRWRIVPGVVQYSADGGVTWATQQTGASMPLTAGSSPVPSVCWLVGRAGTVLRSSDGGRQWQRVAFPEAVDLVGVRASNALTAAVDLADGRRLATTDGGQTWLPNP